MLLQEIKPFVRYAVKQKINDINDFVNYDYRFFYCVNGEGVFTVNDKRFPFKRDTFIMWKVGGVYSYEPSDSLATEVISGNFDYTNNHASLFTPVPPDIKANFNPDKLISESVYFEDASCLNDTVYIPKASNLGETVEKLQTEYNKKVKYQNLKCSIILQELILQVVTFIENDAFVAEDNLVVKVIDYIRKHYKENPSNREIGKHFGYHPNYLNSIVVKYSGESIHSYLMSYKMSKALDMLMTTNLSVKQIALSLNIQDQQYFSRCFKKIYGKQPSSFRS